MPAFVEPPQGRYKVERGSTYEVLLEVEDVEGDEVRIQVDLGSA